MNFMLHSERLDGEQANSHGCELILLLTRFCNLMVDMSGFHLNYMKKFLNSIHFLAFIQGNRSDILDFEGSLAMVFDSGPMLIYGPWIMYVERCRGQRSSVLWMIRMV